MKDSISQSRLKELFEYSKDTGEFKWKIRSAKNIRIGQSAGCKRKDGYIVIRCDGKLYLAHRLAWLYCFGQFPEDLIDHIDGNPSNNRLDNLRSANASINCQNLHKPNRRSRDGFIGAGRHKGKWMAQIRVNGKKVQLGTYATPELASAAYKAAKRLLHPGCTI